MYYTDDPLLDFDRWDRAQSKRLKQLPVCADCGDAVQDDHYYLINDAVICPDCMESGYRKDVDDYIE